MKIPDGQRIAVVGAGVSGLVSAWLLSRRHHVTLFEKDGRLGGHTSTVTLEQGPDAGMPVDTGFIVCNDRTYPLFHRFLRELNVPVRAADMSFGFWDSVGGLQYAGTDLNGLLAQRRNLFRPRFWRLISEVRRFHRAGAAALAAGGAAGLSFGDWLRREGFGGDAVEQYIVPMGAAIWSAPFQGILSFPAETYLRFFGNHGLLSVADMPQWQTVVGGSHRYVRAFRERFTGVLRPGEAVRSLRRENDGVVISTAAGGEEAYDHVVLAGHADQSLALLADPDEDERSLLGAWRYQHNDTVLHTDRSVLPPLKRAWASWNYLRTEDEGRRPTVAVSYHMNRLQGLHSETDYIVSLNLGDRIDPAQVIRRFEYEHPVYSAEAVATQPRLPGLNGRRRTWYAGSYFRYGFHEDAVMSADAVGRAFWEGL
jgi:predicted NAD/FAD-binding protein